MVGKILSAVVILIILIPTWVQVIRVIRQKED